MGFRLIIFIYQLLKKLSKKIEFFYIVLVMFLVLFYNRSAFESKTQTDEERIDFLKLKNNWELLESTVQMELATPVPNILLDEWRSKILGILNFFY